MAISVYGIGNPLIDIVAEVSEEELASFGLHKGTMYLIDDARRRELLSFIEGREITYECGGSAPNTLLTLALFGMEVSLAGTVGEDEYGDLYRRRLSELAVVSQGGGAGGRDGTRADGPDSAGSARLDCGGTRSSGLTSCPAPTGTSIILVTPDSERTMNTFLGANRHFSPEDVNEEEVQAARYLYFAGFMWDTENQKQGVMRAIRLIEEAGGEVVFDLADPFATGRNREEFLALLRDHVDIVFANGEEARILLDHYDPAECAKELGEICGTAVVKDGPRGSYVFGSASVSGGDSDGSGCEVEHVPVEPLRAVDSTGAGDTFSAGFLLGLLRGRSLRESARIASALAGKVILKRGAQLSRDEIADFRMD